MTRYVTGTQRESKNYKERIPAIPYMYGNAEAGITLRDVFLKGATLDIHYMMNYIRQFSYEWNTYNNPELDLPTQFSHDLFVSYNFGRKSEFTVSAECTNIFNARLRRLDDRRGARLLACCRSRLSGTPDGYGLHDRRGR